MQNLLDLYIEAAGILGVQIAPMDARIYPEHDQAYKFTNSHGYLMFSCGADDERDAWDQFFAGVTLLDVNNTALMVDLLKRGNNTGLRWHNDGYWQVSYLTPIGVLIEIGSTPGEAILKWIVDQHRQSHAHN